MNALVPVRVAESVARSRGRPEVYDAALADEIIERLTEGQYLTQICLLDHMPSIRTVYNWMRRDPEFDAEVARAREIGAMGWLEEAKAIADEPLMGNVTTYKTGGIIELRREDMLGHRKLQIETREKIAAKLCPARFGGQKAVDGGNTTIINGNVNNVTLENTPQEAAEIYAEKLKKIG